MIMKKVLFTLCAVLCSVYVASAQFRLKPFEFKVKYRGEVTVGGAFSNKLQGKYAGTHVETASEASRLFVETVHGVMVSDYIFVGVGVGLQNYAGEIYKGDGRKWNTLTIPIFADLKGFLPINRSWRTFMNLGLGGSVVGHSDLSYVENGFKYKQHGGFYCDFGAGVEYRSLSFGIGLQHQTMRQSETWIDYGMTHSTEKFYTNAFYVKLGVNF